MHKFTIKFSLLFKAFITCLEGISLAYIHMYVNFYIENLYHLPCSVD